MTKTITFDGKTLQYTLVFKNIKRINLRVKNDGKIFVSAPLFIGEKRVEKFVLDNFNRVYSLFIKKSEKDKFYLFGKPYKIDKVLSEKNSVLIGEDSIVFSLKNLGDFPVVLKKFLKRESKDYLLNLVDKIFPLFSRYKITHPKISFKYMTTRWGSCNKVKGKINLSTALLCVPVYCAEYVVVHELAHLIEMNHSKKFYSIIESVMPDYKMRRALLKKTDYMY